jgi:hypothetical protein
MGKTSKQTMHASARKGAISHAEKTTDMVPRNEGARKEVVAEHLPPLGLVFTVIACSGFLFVFAFRDVFATGKIVGGAMDEAMLVGQFWYYYCRINAGNV